MDAYKLKLATSIMMLKFTRFIFNQPRKVLSLLEAGRKHYEFMGRGLAIFMFNSPREVQCAINEIESSNPDMQFMYARQDHIKDSELGIAKHMVQEYDTETSFVLAMVIINPGSRSYVQVVHCFADSYYIVSPNSVKNIVQIGSQENPPLTASCVRI